MKAERERYDLEALGHFYSASAKQEGIVPPPRRRRAWGDASSRPSPFVVSPGRRLRVAYHQEKAVAKYHL